LQGSVYKNAGLLYCLMKTSGGGAPAEVGMVHRGLRTKNHPAIIGFLLPFVSAGLASVYVLWNTGDYASPRFQTLFVVLIPLVLGLGLFLSIRSVPLIQEKGDKDYAYSGLVLNIFFILLYAFSFIYIALKRLN
jgi:drug/metabolite transporter (DMT)-like permease